MNSDAIEMSEAGSQARRIAERNDAFRRDMIDGTNADVPQGKVVVTRAVADEGPVFQLLAMRAVALDQTFTEDNDPYGDHTFGTVMVEGRKVWWKIDLYDLAYEYGAETPADPTRTRRVLTILSPEDY